MTRLLNLVFPDGTLVSGATYLELEDALRASQMTTFPSRRAFRREMRRRCQVWNGVPVKPAMYPTSRTFVMQLVHADLCMLEVVTDDADHAAANDFTDPRNTNQEHSP